MAVVFMVLGLLLLGMVIGAAAAGAWLAAGGSLLLAIVIYGFAGSFFMLGFAFLSCVLADHRARARAEPLQPAE